MMQEEDHMIDNQKLAMTLRSFAAERDWDQFHTPKNLATSISVEAAELLEIFQWSRGQEGWKEVTDRPIRARVEDELADILLYLIRFADKAEIDLQAIAERKIASNGISILRKDFAVQIASTMNRTEQTLCEHVCLNNGLTVPRCWRASSL
jgi:NTP pyrophosphatase (non-canonical NTP hydrolase)